MRPGCKRVIAVHLPDVPLPPNSIALTFLKISSIFRISVCTILRFSVLLLFSYFVDDFCVMFFVVCLFVWGFSSHSVIFNPYGDVTNTGEGLQILTIARHSWSFRSAGSLACHTYRDMGHSFMMVSSEDRDTHTCCRAFNSGDALPVFTTYICTCRSVAAGIRTPNFPHAWQTL